MMLQADEYNEAKTQPEVFYLNAEYCCLIYKDYLVVNLPVDKLEERINMIDTDWRPGYWKRYRDFYSRNAFFRAHLANNSKSHLNRFISHATVSFKLDKYLILHLKGSDLLIWRTCSLIFGNLNNEFAEGQEATLLQWLDKKLSERGFVKKTKKLSKKAGIIYWPLNFILCFILVFAMGYEGPPENLWDQIIAFAIIAGILLVFLELVGLIIRLVRKPQKGPTIVYRKKWRKASLARQGRHP